MSTNNEIPTGNYDCWATTDPDSGVALLPITADKEGWPQIKITVAIAEKGNPEAFATAEVYQTIDPDAPARGGSEKSPYDFAVLCLLALGAESREAIEEALYHGIMSAEQVVVVPGVGAEGKLADAKVTHKPGNNGGTFQNVAIFGKREVAPDKRAALAAKFKRPAAGGAAPAFVPGRGSQVAAPPPRPAA
jgi:hypothetical protein